MELARRPLVVGLLLAALLACKRSGSEIAVEAVDHGSRMRIPSSWETRTDLNDKADLQVGNRLKQEFLIVLTESKEDFAAMDPARLLEHHLSKLESGLTAPTRVPLPTTQIGVYPARQAELHGTAGNVNVVYLVSAVEGPKRFHGIIAWTTKSHWSEARPLLERTVLTFQEI